MTQITIDSQIEAIKKATENASKSKQKARKFLIAAGIIEDEKQKDRSEPLKGKK